ncbi:hypothetical protein FEF22_000625 [Texas Phoenix palm phytoplasma]|uniref:Preprotein translocase subunit SecE n=1 Tax=Texas Phoenix palm phytoplasma TaxID=176709 RepID=A0ABS5BI85_9MOLU|nr:hypothetical protein [Texas Phoenix palm phytoplasma]MBP3059293.1 hypothetical protein [Texas Phoenix palm phytoplasma]
MILIELFNTIFSFVKDQYKNLLQLKNVDFSILKKMLTSLGSLCIVLFGFTEMIFSSVVLYFKKLF